MKYFYLFLLLTLCECSSAQIFKVYLTKSGKFSNDPQNAISYILAEKLESDSAYLIKQFDMRETMLMQGTYKNAALTIPHGKFTYYNKKHTSSDKISSSPDTGNFVESIGYFSNGKRVGTWTDYASKGIKRLQYTYENDELNGPYTKYFNDYDGHWSVGTMMNGKLEGKFYMYNADSLLVAETDYVNGKSVNKITHWIEAKPPDNYKEFLEKQLIRFKQIIHDSPPMVVKFTVSSTGKILDPKIIKSIDNEINAALISSILSAKPFSPATYDARPVGQVIFKSFILFRDKEPEDMIRRVKTKMKFEDANERRLRIQSQTLLGADQ
ncbi:MAG: Gram-negative bacterial tonB protein [Mucilaginibacter sp.]|nr:Gram-negative bacterial tonB protein [Mucilaginibacter sp.]